MRNRTEAQRQGARKLRRDAMAQRRRDLEHAARVAASIDSLERHENACAMTPEAPLLGGAQIIADRNATCAVLQGSLPGGRAYQVTGSAKREKGDPYDPRVGSALALARALRSAADELDAYGMDLVRAAEAEAGHRRARSRNRAEAHEKRRLLLLPLHVIREQYGEDAAGKAASRRGTVMNVTTMAAPVWRLEGKDGFDPDADYYHVSHHETEAEAVKAAHERRQWLNKAQPDAGGQAGIQDRVYIVHPDGRRVKW